MVEELDPKKENILANYTDAKIFRCKNCSSDTKGAVMISWDEAIKEGNEERRKLLKCPKCEQTIGIYSLDNPVNPEVFSK